MIKLQSTHEGIANFSCVDGRNAGGVGDTKKEIMFSRRVFYNIF